MSEGWEALERAAGLIRQGGVVAFPTESWYGLAVDPGNPEAVGRLFALKNRPADKPILILLADRSRLDSLVTAIPPPYQPLMDIFWPGPLTLVFPAAPHLGRGLTAGTGTVAVRLSSHPLARELAARCGGMITGTSANVSGAPPLSTAREVRTALGRGLDMIVDGGPTPGGSGSTIIRCSGDRLVCVRGGQISMEAVEAAVEQAVLDGALRSFKEENNE